MGRTASGVNGLNTDGGEVVGLALSHEGPTLLSISANGYGKRTALDEFRLTSRGTKGVTAMKITDKTGPLMSVYGVNGDEDAMIVTSDGIMIRISLKDVSLYKRATQGVRMINVNDDAQVTRLTLVRPEEEAEADGGEVEESTDAE